MDVLLVSRVVTRSAVSKILEGKTMGCHKICDAPFLLRKEVLAAQLFLPITPFCTFFNFLYNFLYPKMVEIEKIYYLCIVKYTIGSIESRSVLYLLLAN